ncbi:MAG: fused MFS/spermidine synthase, partial [Spirochaetes bacterium]|nr:fused MFS/spermidine synthase [Spirochaetota bacterium]
GRVARDRSFFRGYYDNRYRKNYEIIYSFENYLDTKVVIKKAGLKYLLAGPFLSGSTESKRQSVQTLQGHIPMLLTQGKENILEIGYGVGQIARSIYRYRPADFDIVEIDPDMVRIANRFFNEVNDRVTDKKGVRVSIMDGRHFLDIQDKQYDLIMSDTFFIFSEASTRLYTLEHFTRARKHLKEGGLCLCWIPGNMGVLPGLSIIKTFQTVFPDLLAWRYPEKKSSDIFLIGRKGKKKFSLSQFFNRYRKTARNDLMRVGIKDPYELLSGFFNIKEIMPAVCGSRAILLHIEDKPFLDFAFSMDISRKLLDDVIKEYFFKDDTGWLDEYFSFHDLPGEKIKIRRQKFRAIQHLR